MRATIGVATVDEGLLKALEPAYRRWQKNLSQDLAEPSKAIKLRLLVDGYLLSVLANLAPPKRREMQDILH